MPFDVRKVYRSRRIIGTPVRNKAGEDLGEIEEVVVDLEHHRLAYAVLSFGGFLGMGDKLVAIPWTALSLGFGEEGKYFLLEVDREKLKSAPRIDKKQWPTEASADWIVEVNQFYQKAEPAEEE